MLDKCKEIEGTQIEIFLFTNCLVSVTDCKLIYFLTENIQSWHKYGFLVTELNVNDINQQSKQQQQRIKRKS